MNAAEINGFIVKIDGYYSSAILKSPERIECWSEVLGYLPIDRCLLTLKDLNIAARDKKQSYAPSIIDFQRAYYRRYPKKHKVTAIPSSDCCHKGHRYLLMAGHHPHMKPLDIRKMACREDQAGTVYEHYTVVRVPCSCEAGQMINSKTDKYDYSFDILKKFYDHSFPDRTTADEFFKSKVSDKDLIH